MQGPRRLGAGLEQLLRGNLLLIDWKQEKVSRQVAHTSTVRFSLAPHTPVHEPE